MGCFGVEESSRRFRQHILCFQCAFFCFDSVLVFIVARSGFVPENGLNDYESRMVGSVSVGCKLGYQIGQFNSRYVVYEGVWMVMTRFFGLIPD